MEDLTKFYAVEIREGVMIADSKICNQRLTNEFNEWKNKCGGKVILLSDFTGDHYDNPKRTLYFKNEDDITFYRLTFDEIQIDPPFYFKMQTVTVSAKPRKLNGTWTFTNE